MNLLRFSAVFLFLSLCLGFIQNEAREFNYRRNIQLIEEAIDYADDYRFYMAKWKLETVRVDLINLDARFRRHASKIELEQTLLTAIQKLSDWRLNRREKAEVVEDCGDVAIRAIQDLRDGGRHGNNEVRRALRLMDDAMADIRSRRYRTAIRILEDIIVELEDEIYASDNVEEAVIAAETMIAKLEDSHLRHHQKLEVAEDCFKVFKDALRDERSGRPGPGPRPQRLQDLSDAVDLISNVKESLQTRVRGRVSRKINRVVSFLESYYRDWYLDSAISDLEGALETLEEKDLGYFEMGSLQRDLSSAQSSIMRSRAFDREQDRKYKHLKTTYMGKTKLFSKKRFETRRLQGGTLVRGLQALKVVAKDDAIAIDYIKVVLKNGSTRLINGFTLSENASTFVDCPIGRRKIDYIEVRAVSSPGWFGTKARVQIYGLN